MSRERKKRVRKQASRRRRFQRLLIEPLESRLLLAVDFGDAPEPYPALLADDGARHDATGPSLGANRDGESDGIATLAADGDDLAGTADEDGVTFGTVQAGQASGTVTVNVQGGTGKLDAWIDFSQDGNWGGPSDRIFAARDVVAGDNVLTFPIPADAVAGETFARFRLSTAGGLPVFGAAADGEVEDHALTILPPAVATGAFSAAHPVNLVAQQPYAVATADVDGDGDLDVLSASYTDDKIAWYENDGGRFETEHVITTSANGAYDVFTIDVDGDGDIDALSASGIDDKIAWYENDGSGNFAARTISTSADNARSVYAADVDGDGDTDVLSASYSDDKIAWYENDGSEGFTEHVITTTADSAYDVTAADFDGDGDIDVLSASASDNTVAWYENDGSENFTKHTISTDLSGVRSVYATDVDGDGDLDVISGTYNSTNRRTVWFDNDGSGNFSEQVLGTTE